MIHLNLIFLFQLVVIYLCVEVLLTQDTSYWRKGTILASDSA